MKRFDRWLHATVVFVCLQVVSGAAHAATPAQGAFFQEDAWNKMRSGVTFITPAGWEAEKRTDVVLMKAPGADASVALLDITASSSDQALSMAWQQYASSAAPVPRSQRERPVRGGWKAVRSYTYETGKGDGHILRAQVLQDGPVYAVVIMDVAADVMDRREAQFTRILTSIRAPGFVPETLVGRKPRELDRARTDALVRFVEEALIALDIPGLALGVVQDGKVKVSRGFGVRRKGDPDAVDGATRFLTASVTKPLTSLMLAKLVDEGKLRWDTPAMDALPQFRVGDPVLRQRVQVRHLLCACTGIPAQDMEGIFSGDEMGPNQVLDVLATIKPTAEPGQLYQYSNLMAVAAGYLGAHVAHPELPLDRAYDLTMQERVLDPLGMSSTTFDFDVALSGNVALPHGVNVDGITEPVPMGYNRMSIPMRPDGGAWSSIDDLVRYLQMELAAGRLPEGGRYIGKDALHERLKSQVARGGVDQWYAMGLKTDRRLGILQAVHGGSMAGYQAEVFWLPETGAGYVLLANADAGAQLRSVLSDRFLELLFDVDYGAQAALREIPSQMKEAREAHRRQLQRPIAPHLLASLAPTYSHPTLGRIDIKTENGRTWFDFGGWSTEVAAVLGEGDALESISPSVAGMRFDVSHEATVRTLVLDDGQRSYTFREGERPVGEPGLR